MKTSNSAQMVLITGAPAAGKFTVGKILSKRTGIPLLHNHIIIDLVKTLFPNEKCKSQIREPLFFDLLTFAAKQGHSLIVTYAYAQNYTSANGLNDVAYVKKIKTICESAGGLFVPVHLNTSTKEVIERTDAPSRKKFHKLKDKKEMRKVLKEWDVVTPPPFKNVLIIDNSKLSAAKTAKMIEDVLK